MTGALLFKIVLAASVGLALAVFQYHQQGQAISRQVRYTLIAVRAALVALLLLLLLNPYISYHSQDPEKPILAVIADQSESVKNLGGAPVVRDWLARFTSDKALQEAFQVQTYWVDSTITSGVRPGFTGKATRLDLIGPYLKSQWYQRPYAAVVLTDGNQTAGPSWVYQFAPKRPVFPVAVADTARPIDLYISHVQANRYAFLHNQFPIEIQLGYQGKTAIQAQLVVESNHKRLVQKLIRLTPVNASQPQTLLLPAHNKGLMPLQIRIESPIKERNLVNNAKLTAVEVVDVPSRIALVSAFAHPDVGALQRALSRDKQRQVDVLRPGEVRPEVRYAAQVWFQPNAAFQPLLARIQQQRTPLWICTGMHTDFGWLQQQWSDFQWQMSRQTEYFQAIPDTTFSGFNDPGLRCAQMPALAHPFGLIKPLRMVQPIWQSKLKGQGTLTPLLAEVKGTPSKRIYLMGEGLWRWRSTDYLQAGQFDQFDQWVQKMVQYLCAAPMDQPLVVSHDMVYESGQPVEITAQFFNPNHEPDPDAQLEVAIQSSGKPQRAMMLRSQQSYQTTFSGLTPGTYRVQVVEKRSKIKYNSQIILTPFQAEKQATHVRWDEMQQLANSSKGQAFTASDFEACKRRLLQENALKTVLHDRVHLVSLLDWPWWWVMALLLLSIEWFLRKYHGLL